MFKSMEPNADYYWLQDQDGHALSPLQCFGLRTDEIKNLMADAALAKHMQLKNSLAPETVAQPVLQALANANLTRIKAQNISDLKLVHHLLWIENNNILQRDTVLAEVNPAEQGI